MVAQPCGVSDASPTTACARQAPPRVHGCWTRTGQPAPSGFVRCEPAFAPAWPRPGSSPAARSTAHKAARDLRQAARRKAVSWCELAFWCDSLRRSARTVAAHVRQQRSRQGRLVAGHIGVAQHKELLRQRDLAAQPLLWRSRLRHSAQRRARVRSGDARRARTRPPAVRSRCQWWRPPQLGARRDGDASSGRLRCAGLRHVRARQLTSLRQGAARCGSTSWPGQSQLPLRSARRLGASRRLAACSGGAGARGALRRGRSGACGAAAQTAL